MTTIREPTRYGHIYPPDTVWLAKAAPEPILEPDLPIIDTHHHLWVRDDQRYLLHEFMQDIRSGHNTVATVFLECHSMYRSDGPEEMRSVGETEFVAGIAPTMPASNIIMGHCGGPLGYGRYLGKQDEVFATWKAGVTELAKCPNVTMKLGGMMMRLAAYDYRALPKPPTSAEIAALWRPYIETCIELFGAHRCLFESNFPVEKMGASWGVLWNAFKRIAAGASADEKLALFSGTARRTYRLE